MMNSEVSRLFPIISLPFPCYPSIPLLSAKQTHARPTHRCTLLKLLGCLSKQLRPCCALYKAQHVQDLQGRWGEKFVQRRTLDAKQAE